MTTPLGRTRPAAPALVAFVDEHRDRFGGVEPIRRVRTRPSHGVARRIVERLMRELGLAGASAEGR